MATETATARAPNLNLCAILSESKRIINAHSRHFLALSVIFLLPLSFSLVVFPTLFHLILTPNNNNNSRVHILIRYTLLTQTPQTPQTLTQTTSPPPPLPFSLPLLLFSLPLLLFSLFLFLFSLFSLATITHSVFHGFFGRPVKLLSAITSILTSFTPLLATTIVSHSILSSISLLLPLLLQSIHLLGFKLSYSSPFFLFPFSLLVILFIFFLLYLRVSWTLASVIAVVESTWGFAPMKRSAALMKGMKWVGVSSLFFFGSLEGILLWSGSVLTVGYDGGAWKDWAFVVQIVMTSTVLMLLLLYNTAANTVLYMYCKAVHGELALEIAEEFAWEYISLPFDDGKVPHVVSVVHV
ncbi:uncharacterized protein LOC133311034 [Gastrolobium bilobum]|uniref:uncharacterized protein LOC133311034 n=1 Tax=Gastrolobium bilobum TaxID=150636 RepID=UPI002AB0032E|nr:uncharacterized protein LOC133311034 [Gastrolobium bilobum]